MGDSKDYIYLADGREILIETEQRRTREQVITQYVRYRKALGITQAELAKRIGVPRSNITRFESGAYNPSLEMMVKVAAALGAELKIGLGQK